mgnify:CR=1 FL=1
MKEIGDRYERYIGYLYERAGWVVDFNGLKKGVMDEGVDLFCHTGEITHIVQAKYWSDAFTAKNGIIAVINKLAAFRNAYAVNRPLDESVFAVLVIKSKLGIGDKSYAEKRNVIVLDGLAIPKDYPIVKCVEKEGQKFFYLPFLGAKPQRLLDAELYGAGDWYDEIRVNYGNGDRYVHTVAQAEKLGYRYAGQRSRYGSRLS